MHPTVALSSDHPGFHDQDYRTRRDAIAALSDRHVSGTPAPRVGYSAADQQTWTAVWAGLLPRHRQFVCTPLQAAQERLRLWAGPLPQLADLDRTLQPQGFRMEPVSGLVSAPEFLRALGEGVFLATQYVRHESRPHYTPEPDVIHELVGHAASLTVPEIAALSRAFGRAARTEDPNRLVQLERLYWHTLEFGAVLEHGRVRAVGAGLLSSIAEIDVMTDAADTGWSVARLMGTPYDPTDLQPRTFVAPSWEEFLDRIQTELHRKEV